MKNIIAENFLRFAPKNLSINDYQTIKKLIEQTDAQAKGFSVARIKQIVDADRQNRNTFNNAQEVGNCVFIKSFKVQKATIDSERINAQFWNNMVTLETGLMSPTRAEIIAQVQQSIATIKERKLDNLEITITGTATSAPAMNQVDPRLVKQNPNATLDHNYGGQAPNNQFLAQNRAASIEKEFKKLLPNAKYIIKTNIIQGGFADDASRYIQVDVTGDKTTADTITYNDIYLDWEVSYGEVTGAGLQGRSDFVDEKPTVGYKATLTINYGQKNYPTFVGKVFFESYDANNNDPAAVIVDPQRATRKTYPYLVRGAGHTDNPAFSTFIRSCGHFDTTTADAILSSVNIKTNTTSMYRVDSAVFKKLAEKKSGNLQDFINIVGGEQTPIIDVNHAKASYVYDVTVTPPVLTKTI